MCSGVLLIFASLPLVIMTVLGIIFVAREQQKIEEHLASVNRQCLCNYYAFNIFANRSSKFHPYFKWPHLRLCCFVQTLNQRLKLYQLHITNIVVLRLHTEAKHHSSTYCFFRQCVGFNLQLMCCLWKYNKPLLSFLPLSERQHKYPAL